MDKEIKDKKLRNELDQRGYYTIQLIKGEGYFYWIDTDEEDKFNLQRATSTSVYVCHYNQQSPEQWVKDLVDLIDSLK